MFSLIHYNQIFIPIMPSKLLLISPGIFIHSIMHPTKILRTMCHMSSKTMSGEPQDHIFLPSTLGIKFLTLHENIAGYISVYFRQNYTDEQISCSLTILFIRGDGKHNHSKTDLSEYTQLWGTALDLGPTVAP